MNPELHGKAPALSGSLEWTLSFDPADQIVVARTEGPLDERSMPAMLQAVTDFAEENKCVRVLGDHRASELKMSVVDVYQSPEALEELEANRKNRAALVYSNITDLHRFMETVYQNRGRKLALFADIESARAWLKS